MLKKIVCFFVFCVVVTGLVKAQSVALPLDTLKGIVVDTTAIIPDSVALKVADTITPKILMPLDSAQMAHFVDSLSKGLAYETFDLQKLIDNYHPNKEKIDYRLGSDLPRRNVWVMAIIAFLLVLFAILKNTFSKQLSAVIQSFYSNRALGNLSKEDNLTTSWSFLLLFIQFGFTIGMFFYLTAQFKNVPETRDGFQFFVVISISIILLYILKIIVLRVFGFVFDIQKPLNEYISILYLSYFNASLLFIPLIIAFALSPAKYGSLYINLGIGLLAVIFVFQFLRAAANILSQYRFSKVYLFLYFCTLEICPILILIKTIGL